MSLVLLSFTIAKSGLLFLRTSSQVLAGCYLVALEPFTHLQGTSKEGEMNKRG